VIAFSSSGFSFIEKGLMLIIAKKIGKSTIIAPRSGYLVDEINASAIFKKIALKILTYCDKIICQGKYWNLFFINVLGQEKSKLQVVHNWIDLAKYNHSIHKLNSPIKITFLGWINENKGIWNLLEVVKVLENKDFILNIAGNGKDFEKLKKKIIEEELENKINLLGWIYGDEKVKLLNDSDIFILPSFKEGLPNALLEAMASFNAIITTNVGAIPDIIQNSFNGFLVKPNDTNQLTEALEIYLENNEMIHIHAKNALETVRSVNSIEAIIPKFKTLLAV
jgi:glycosyltransferase involved in cell wall biosynthesis